MNLNLDIKNIEEDYETNMDFESTNFLHKKGNGKMKAYITLSGFVYFDELTEIMQEMVKHHSKTVRVVLDKLPLPEEVNKKWI